MGKLTIVQGRANTGKSKLLSELLHECMQQGRHGLYIVPEQYTFEAERTLSHAFSGLLGVEVLSFSRLAERILSQSGRNLPFLSKQGRNMVIRRAIYQKQKALLLFANAAQKSDFADRMDLLISQFKQSRITPEQLASAMEGLEEGSLLYQKLHDIRLIFETSEKFLASRYLTANDLSAAAISRMKNSFVKDCYVYIDGFDNPSNELYSFFEAILCCAKSVTITLRQDPDFNEALFAPDMRAKQRLMEIAARNGCPVGVQDRRKKSKNTALDHLERNLFFNQWQSISGNTDQIRIYAQADRRAEAEQLGDLVLARAREGVRYRDMAVVCPDLKLYGSHIKRAFFKRGIPLFFDAKKSVQGQAAIVFLLNAVRAAIGGYSVQNVLALIKSGYGDVETADAEIFENYLLRYGIFGSSLTAPFCFGEVPEAAEQVRSKIMPPLMVLHDRLKAGSAIEKIIAVQDYLNDMQLVEKLQSEAQKLQEEGRTTQAQEFLQLNNTILEVFNQIALILGDTFLSMAEFEAILSEGLAAYQIGSVPSNADQIMLGDVSRSKIKRVDTLFVVGCNEGLIPRQSDDGVLLNDSELKRMSDCGLSVWSDSRSQMQNDRLELYSLLTKADNRLYLSYACSDNGAALSPSLLIDKLRRIFEGIKVRTGLQSQDELPSCLQTGFSELVRQYRLFGQEGTHTLLLPALVEVYKSEPLYAPRLKRILDGEVLNNSPAPISRELALSLYGQNARVSASRLELFNKCPFSHFESYGLRADKRKEYAEEITDIGTFVHDALDAFVRYVMDNNLDWEEINELTVDAIVDRIMPERIIAHNDGIFVNNPRLKEGVFLLETRIKLACRSVAKQAQLGLFKPACSEYSFGMGLDNPPLTLISDTGRRVEIRGKIDRIDTAEMDNQKLLRVVDYKYGSSRRLEPARIESGETLQLPLYLKAARSLQGEGVAMYYMPTGQKIPNEEKEQSEIHALYGVTAEDKAVIEATEKNMGVKSSYVGSLKFNKQGLVSGDVCSREELRGITELAARIACQTVERMYEGEAEVLPTGKACDYCDYASVCRFDSILGNKKKAVPSKSLKELVEEVQQ